MTPSDHTTAAALDRISRAMTVAELCEHQNTAHMMAANDNISPNHQPPGNTAPRFINLRNGGNLPRRDLIDASPPLIFAAFMACVVLFVAFDWICARYLW